MKINHDKVQKLAKLARLNFDNKETQAMIADLEKMLQFVDKLNEIDTDNVQPLTHLHQDTNIFRKDIVKNSDTKNSILSNAPNHNSDYIKVPKVLRKK